MGISFDARKCVQTVTHVPRLNCYLCVQTVPYAKDNLVTVRGGIAEGDPCGGGHLHSHQGREEVVMSAIVSWNKTRKVERLIGE